MASINASTSGAGGLISTADATGILNIQTAGTTAVTVDASQNVNFVKAISALAVGGNVTKSNDVIADVNGSSTALTYTDTGASLTLNAGTYLILSNAILSINGQSGTSVVFRFPVIALTDNSNNVVFSQYGNGASSSSMFSNTTLCNILTVSSTTTYKTRFSSINNSGTSTISSMGLNATSTVIHNIIAIRLT